MIRILLADDHQMFIDGVKAFLKSEPSIQVVAEALNRDQVLKAMEQHPVDVVVLDVRMPTDEEGELACKILKKKYPKTKVLMLTQEDRGEKIQKFIYHKANGYILKDRSKEELIGAIHAVYNNNSYYPPSIMNKAIEAPSYMPEEEVTFSKREKEVLILVAKGMRDKDIADQLHIAETTVYKHGQNLRKKVGASNRVELTNYAREKGIV